MRRRQVHLDFHTSENIPGIGESFDRQQFQAALQLGHVDSITVFSKCHHGWAYHPSQANEQHPNLHFDLLGAQIEAAHAIGVKTPVYLSAGLDEKMARRHPDWLIRRRDETTTWVPDFTRPGYHRFCFNSPYLDYLLAQIAEVVANYDADGIFLDIVGVTPCYCQNCVRTLREEGKNPYDPADAMELGERVYANYCRKVRETVDRYKPGLPVFQNSGHISRGRRDLAHFNTHLELESLPTGGWGYDHFPLSAAYVRTLGMDFLGMTGKFHTSWGEFGGYKHPNALRYEVALAAANGACSSIGDQLHPSGKMDTATYALIGAAYGEIEKKEPWLEGAQNRSDIALFSTESAINRHTGTAIADNAGDRTGLSDAGAARMLLEGHYLFDVADDETDLSAYRVVILPDTIRLDEALAGKLRAFTAGGGRILTTGQSGLKTDADDYALDFGVKCTGKAPCTPSYFRPAFPLKAFENAAFVMYTDARALEKTDGEILGTREDPYFNRSVEHFCSHQHTPCANRESGPAVSLGQDGAVIAWEIFRDYAQMGSLILREMFCYVMDRLLEDNRSVTTDLPAQGVMTLTEQNGRHILHALYASPVRRGKGIEIIEDIVPLYGIHASVRLPQKPARVYLAPQGKDIPYTWEDGRASFTIPEISCHQMVVME